MTAHQELQLKYWTKFNEFLNDANSKLENNKTANALSWHAIAMGRSWEHLEAIATKKENRVELRLKGEDAKINFDKLKAYELESAKVIKGITWERLDNNLLSKIYVSRPANIEDQDRWKEQFEWLKIHLDKMYAFFINKL